jgi:hypothetical protein
MGKLTVMDQNYPSQSEYFVLGVDRQDTPRRGRQGMCCQYQLSHNPYQHALKPLNFATNETPSASLDSDTKDLDEKSIP